MELPRGHSEMSYVYGLGAFRPIERLRWSLITPDDVSVVRCLRSIVIPGNETCFYVFEAPSAEAVREGSRRAAIGFERIVPVIQVEPSSSTHRLARGEE
jgi:hypothetical protein